MLNFIYQYWLEFIFGLAIASLSFCYKTLSAKYKEQELVKAGLLAILHDRLFQEVSKYIKQGEITVSQLENFDELYRAYHDLGGNGTGTEMYKRVHKLKIIVEE